MDKRLLLVGLVVTLGCGGSPTMNTPDAFVPTDAGPVDAFVPPTPALVLMGGGAPDYTCLGTATAPMGAADVTASLHAVEYLSDADVASQVVEIWGTNVIGTTCAAPDCMMVTTDAMGTVDFSAPAGAWYAYRLPASAGTAQVLAYNRPFPTAGGSEEQVTAFSMGTISTVSALLRRMFSATAGAASGTVQDCMGRGVMNARIRLFVGGTEVVGGMPSETTTARITGLEGTAPTSSGLTGSGGTFVGANAQPGNYRVEVYGTMTEGGDAELIGCEQGMLVGGGITVFTVGPLRADYPAGSECETAAAAL
jgi:hypothetical protein